MEATYINKIKLIEPIKYKKKTPQELGLYQSDTGNIVPDLTPEEVAFYDHMHIGFNAQEVKEYFPELVFRGQDGFLGVNYDGFIPILLQAINTQQSTIDKFNKDIVRLESEIALFTSESSNKNADLTSYEDSELEINNVAQLYQNNPNPFNKETEIKFYIPKESTQAFLRIYDMQGLQKQKIEIQDRETSFIILQSSSLAPGMYMYSLIIDGKEIDTKRMIITD